MLDGNKDVYYVGGLVTSYFKDLVKEANAYFTNQNVTIYKVKKKIWGEVRTCVVTISDKLKEGQINGIHQQLEKKYKALEEFKQQLENPNKRKHYSKKEIEERLKKITAGQFISDILKYEIFELKKKTKATKDKDYSFIYYIDGEAFEQIKNELLGRVILVTNRHDWDSKDIIQAYYGQSNVENVFRNLKNPYHMAVRPQFHWTEQKVEVHFLICMIGYLLTVVAYAEAKKKGYMKDIHNFMEDLNKIRLACCIKRKVKKIVNQCWFFRKTFREIWRQSITNYWI